MQETRHAADIRRNCRQHRLLGPDVQVHPGGMRQGYAHQERSAVTLDTHIAVVVTGGTPVLPSGLAVQREGIVPHGSPSSGRVAVAPSRSRTAAVTAWPLLLSPPLNRKPGHGARRSPFAVAAVPAQEWRV